MSDFDDLYRDIILDHAKRPRNRGRPPTATRVATGDNPTCGDNCTVYLGLDPAGRIAAIGFDGQGCELAVDVARFPELTCRCYVSLKGESGGRWD